MVNAVEENLIYLKGRNYVRKAGNGRYWLDFSANKMQFMSKRFGDDFFLIIHGSKGIDDDYFVIPYAKVKHMFTQANIANDSGIRPPRWVGNIVEERLHITNSGERIDVAEYYGNRPLLEKAMGRSGLS
jgi:hypothetical protein